MGEIVDSRHQQDLYIDGRETITDSGVSGKAPALQLTQQHTQGHQGQDGAQARAATAQVQGRKWKMPWKHSHVRLSVISFAV